MDFVSYIKKRYRSLCDASPRDALQRFNRAMDRAKDLEVLVSADDSSLRPFPTASLPILADAHREYREWKSAARRLRRSLAQSDIPLPHGSLEIAYTPYDIEALERTLHICKRSGYPDHGSWMEAIKAHVQFFEACVEISISDGLAVFELGDNRDDSSGESANLAGLKPILSEVRSYRWLAARRLERAGALRIALILPWDAISNQAAARLPQLGLSAQERGAKAIVDELVAPNLERTMFDFLDSKAEKEALESARSAYVGLLETPGLITEKAIAVYVSKDEKALGSAVLDSAGKVLHHSLITTDQDYLKAVQRIVSEHEPETLILPISDQGTEIIGEIERALGEMPVQRVLVAAIAEARQRMSLGAIEASAVVLGRRALKPAREWGRVDPISLGLGEYPKDVDQEKLGKVLGETKTLVLWERHRKKPTPHDGLPAQAVRGATHPSRRRPNPLVRSIRDLKPGMTVDGFVTNLTRFGAFVNIGLPIEGMIHISQLSDEFVENPSQVVKVGQQVTAHVIEVIPEKRRIALSLKTMSEPRAYDSGRLPQVRIGGDKASSKPTKNRSAALADLDALFKK